MTRWTRALLFLAAVACGEAATNGNTPSPDLPPGGSTPDAGSPAQEPEAGIDASVPRTLIQGDYAGPLLDADGNVDVAATVNRLTEAHVNTYAYLIYKKPQAEWDRLPAFLDAAKAAKIAVWVYLVPPTEAPGGTVACTGDYPPYQLDYVAWAKAIAKLSVDHDNLLHVAIDDFGANSTVKPGAACPKFSPAYVAQMMTAAHGIAPKLGLWPVLYYPDLEGGAAIVQAYRGSITGAIFPFRDGANTNTYVTESAKPEIELLGASLSCRRDFSAADGRGRSGCYQIRYPWGAPSTDGAVAGAAQMVTVDTTTHSMSFEWQHDFAGATSGFVFAQLLVDSAVVWEADIGTVPRYAWRKETVALDAVVGAKATVKVEFRVTHKKGVTNFGQTVWFDEASATGLALQNGDFEADALRWTETSSPNFVAEPVRTTSLVTMVYAATLSSDPDHPPTADYVGTVLGVGLGLAKQGHADGTMTYVLDKRLPDKPIFTRVKATYF